MSAKLKPFRQGDLDGLCGIYAVVNALRCLCPELNRPVSGDLFSELVASLDGRVEKPLHAITYGIEIDVLRKLLKDAVVYMQFNFEVELRVRRLPRGRKLAEIAELWDALRGEVDLGGVAIVTAYGQLEHWTVINRVTDTTVRLFDSAELHFLRLSRCTTGTPRRPHHLKPAEILIVTRASPLPHARDKARHDQ